MSLTMRMNGEVEFDSRLSVEDLARELYRVGTVDPTWSLDRDAYLADAKHIAALLGVELREDPLRPLDYDWIEHEARVKVRLSCVGADKVNAELDRIRANIAEMAASYNAHTNTTGPGPDTSPPTLTDEERRIAELDARRNAAQTEALQLCQQTGAVLEEILAGTSRNTGEHRGRSLRVQGPRLDGFPYDLFDGGDMRNLRATAERYAGDVLDQWGFLIGVKRRKGEPCGVYREALLLATEQEWEGR